MGWQGIGHIGVAHIYTKVQCALLRSRGSGVARVRAWGGPALLSSLPQ